MIGSVQETQCSQDHEESQEHGVKEVKERWKKTLGGSGRLSGCFACSLKDTFIIIIIPM